MINDPNSASTSFTASVEGIYTVELRVSDGRSSSTDILMIEVAANNPWNNSALPEDVDESGDVSPLDALFVINELMTRDFSDPVRGALMEANPSNHYLDVDGDHYVSPLDALLVINGLPITSGPDGAAVAGQASLSSIAII